MGAPDTEPVRSNTPYLDREIPLPPKRTGQSPVRWWQIALVLLTMVLDVFRVIIPLWMVSILIHEVGHVVGGLLTGDQFNYVRVGPFRIDRDRKVSWHWTWNAVLTGGTSTLPIKRSGLRWRVLFSTLTGPGANLMAGWLVFTIMPRNNSMAAAVGFSFVALSAWVGLGNLLPLKQRGRMLDGMRMWVLLFDKRRRERLISMIVLVADVKQGKKVESLEPYTNDEWASVRDDTNQQVITNWLAFHQAKDLELRAQYLEACLAGSSSVDLDLRSLLIIEAAQYQATARNRLDLARAWLNMVRDEKPKFQHYRTEIVILQRERQFEIGLAKIEEALTYVAALRDDATRARHMQALGELKDSLTTQAADSIELGLDC